MSARVLLLSVVVLVGCGGPSPSTAARRTGPDVVSAEWTSGDDAPLEAADPGEHDADTSPR